jgi:hypothetical protein
MVKPPERTQRNTSPVVALADPADSTIAAAVILMMHHFAGRVLGRPFGNRVTNAPR